MQRLHPVFNVVKLTPAPLDPIEGRRAPPPPPPEIVDGEEEWVVEEILDSRMMNRKLRYLVKWKDFGAEHNSWEPWDNVHAPDLVADFHRKHPGAARRIRTADFDSIKFKSILSNTAPGCCFSEGGVDVRGHLPHSPHLLRIQTRTPHLFQSASRPTDADSPHHRSAIPPQPLRFIYLTDL